MRVSSAILPKELDAALGSLTGKSSTKSSGADVQPAKLERQGSSISVKSAVLSESQILELLQLERERRYVRLFICAYITHNDVPREDGY